MNGQQVVELIIEDELLIFPDKLLIRLSVPNNKFPQKVLRETKFLTKKQISNEINKLNKVRIVNSKSSEKNDFFEYQYIEVFDKVTYLELRNNVLSRIPFEIQKIEVYNFSDYESKLKKLMIEKSEKKLQNKGLKLLRLISVESLNKKRQFEQNDIVEKEEMTFKEILKLPFEELTYKGHYLNRDNEIVLKIKLKVKWLTNKI